MEIKQQPRDRECVRLLSMYIKNNNAFSFEKIRYYYLPNNDFEELILKTFIKKMLLHEYLIYDKRQKTYKTNLPENVTWQRIRKKYFEKEA